MPRYQLLPMVNRPSDRLEEKDERGSTRMLRFIQGTCTAQVGPYERGRNGRAHVWHTHPTLDGRSRRRFRGPPLRPRWGISRILFLFCSSRPRLLATDPSFASSILRSNPIVVHRAIRTISIPFFFPPQLPKLFLHFHPILRTLLSPLFPLREIDSSTIHDEPKLTVVRINKTYLSLSLFFARSLAPPRMKIIAFANFCVPWRS